MKELILAIPTIIIHFIILSMWVISLWDIWTTKEEQQLDKFSVFLFGSLSIALAILLK